MAMWPPLLGLTRRTTAAAVAVAATFGAHSGSMWGGAGSRLAAKRSGVAARCWTPWEPEEAAEEEEGERAARGMGCPFCWPPRRGPRCRRLSMPRRCHRFLQQPRWTSLLGEWETACGAGEPEPWPGTAAAGSLPRSRGCLSTMPRTALSGARPASNISSRGRLDPRAGSAAGVDFDVNHLLRQESFRGDLSSAGG